MSEMMNNIRRIPSGELLLSVFTCVCELCSLDCLLCGYSYMYLDAS